MDVMGKATTRRTAVLATVAAVALVGAACASEADPDEYADVITDASDQDAAGESATGDAGASSQALASAADQSAAEAYRLTVSMRLEVSGAGPDEDVSVDADLMTGEFDGVAYETHVDMGTAIAQMNASAGGSGTDTDEFDGMDLTMDIVGDDEVAYIRAPIFAELGDVEAAEDEGFSVTDDAEAFAELAELGDSWGRIEVTEIEGLAPGDMTGALSGGGMGDPMQMLDTLGQGSDPEDIGTDEIDGVEVEGTGFRLSFSDLAGDQAMGSSGSGGMDEEEAAEFADAMFGDIPVEAWVDGDGYVRRISYEIDMSAMFEAFGEFGEGEGEGSGNDMPDTFTMGATVDFTDYGDPGIEIEFPDDADTVDVADAFASVIEDD
jgi:hypothetical protein